MILELKDVQAYYDKSHILNGVNLSVEEGTSVCLLGRNGVGKSTTMNIMCGVLNQTEGEVYINGISLREHPVEAKKHIGFLPQKPPLYPDLTVDEYLTHCALMRLVDKSQSCRKFKLLVVTL